MSHENYLDQEIARLKLSPSVAGWEEELERVLRGQREYNIIPLGGAEEYIAVLLAESKDRPRAEVCFHNALDRVLQRWQPARFMQKTYVAHMLDLLGAYTPLEGFAKVLDRMNQFEKKVVFPGYGAPRNLHLKALLVLEKYFVKAPPRPVDEVPGFKSYLSLLQSYLRDDDYCGYALARLIDLDMLSPMDETTKEVIAQSPEALREVISLLLEPQRRGRLKEDLGHIYEHCLMISEKTREVFKETLQELGVSFKASRHGPGISLDSGESIMLRISPTVRPFYEQFCLQNVEELADLIDQAIQSESEEYELTRLYEHCLETGDLAIREFERALHSVGASFEHSEYLPRVRLMDREIVLAMDERMQERYYETHLQEAEGIRTKLLRLKMADELEEVLRSITVGSEN